MSSGAINRDAGGGPGGGPNWADASITGRLRANIRAMPLNLHILFMLFTLLFLKKNPSQD
jgi:hypothetical protein